MVATAYTYNFSAFPNQKVDAPRLEDEIVHSVNYGFGAFSIVYSYISINNGAATCSIWFNGALGSPDQTRLNDIVAAHSGESLSNPVAQNFTHIPTTSTLIGARCVGDFTPAPAAYVEGGANYDLTPLQSDSSGQLITRGAVLTDERSFRTDFPSTYFTNLTGTVSFTNGSDKVTGVGTLFTSELDKDWLIKLSTDNNVYYLDVLDIISDTELELNSDYLGTTGTGTAIRTRIIPSISTGSVSISNSILSITAGSLNTNYTYAYKEIDYGPLYMHAYANASNSIAGNSLYLGFSANPATPDSGLCCYILFDGTDNTTIKFVTGSTEIKEETTCKLPSGITTNMTDCYYEITISAGECVLCMNSVQVAKHRRHIPKPYDAMILFFGSKNTSVLTLGNTLNIDTVLVSNHNKIEVASSFSGTPLLTRLDEDIHTLYGYRTTTATTAKQTIISYTVPAGKICYISGYALSASGSTVNGSPIYIGKGTLTETIQPGGLDTQIFRAIQLTNKTDSTEQFACPRYLASSGETVLVSVSPDGTGSTVWRVSLDIILR